MSLKDAKFSNYKHRDKSTSVTIDSLESGTVFNSTFQVTEWDGRVVRKRSWISETRGAQVRGLLIQLKFISIIKPSWCTFHSIYWESRASTRTCFKHYLLILRKRCTNGTVYCVRIMSVGCGTVAVKLQSCHSWHYKQAMYQEPFV
jgi:hypothetical protein